MLFRSSRPRRGGSRRGCSSRGRSFREHLDHLPALVADERLGVVELGELRLELGVDHGISVMPQQALAMVNSPLALRASKAVATGWAGLDDTACAQMAFNRILARDPHKDERETAIRFLARQEEMFRRSPPAAKPGDSLSTDPRQRAREHLALALFNHGDFVTIR